VARRRDENALRSELLLCGWLSVGLSAFLACAAPTFTQYFVLLVPFLAMPASLGACTLATHRWTSRAPWAFLIVLVGLYIVSPVKWLNAGRRVQPWKTHEEVAREVDRLTPKDAWIYTYELIYFAARRPPPPGLEHRAAERLDLPPERAAALHITPRHQVDAWLESGRFATVALRLEDPHRPASGPYKRIGRILDVEVWTRSQAGAAAEARD
jgi:hypothetical protein